MKIIKLIAPYKLQQKPVASMPIFIHCDTVFSGINEFMETINNRIFTALNHSILILNL